MDQQPRRLLLVDDEPNVVASLQRAIRANWKDPLKVETFNDPYEALKRCAHVEFEVVLSDFRMPQLSGVEFLHALKQIAPNTVRMMLSAQTDFATVSSAINEAQVFRYLSKPWTHEQLVEVLSAAFEERDRLVPPQRSEAELEAERLERDEPGLLDVKWGPNGEIIL